MDQKAQIIEAILACQRSGDFSGIGKILKKFPEAGAYRLPVGTSIYLDSLINGRLAPLMIGIANGFDPKSSLCESVDQGMSIIEVLLRQSQTDDARRMETLTALGALPELADCASVDALVAAIDVDASTQKWDVFPKISASLARLPGEQIGRVFSAFMSKDRDPSLDAAKNLLTGIDDSTVLLANAAFKEANQVSLIEAAIVRRKAGLAYAFLERQVLRQAIEGIDYVALARECNWPQKDIAQLENFVIGKIVEDASTPPVATANEQGAENDCEPQHAIRRKSMF